MIPSYARQGLETELNGLIARQRQLEWQIYVVSANWERDRLKYELTQVKKTIAHTQARLKALDHAHYPWSGTNSSPLRGWRPRSGPARLHPARKFIFIGLAISLFFGWVAFSRLWFEPMSSEAYPGRGGTTFANPFDRSNAGSRFDGREGRHSFGKPDVPPAFYTPSLSSNLAETVARFEQARAINDPDREIQIGEELVIGYKANPDTAPNAVKAVYNELADAYRTQALSYSSRGNYAASANYYARLVTFEASYLKADPLIQANDYFIYGQALEANGQISQARSAYQTALILGNGSAQLKLNGLNQP